MRKAHIATFLSFLFIGCCVATRREPQIIEIKPVNVVENVLRTACKLEWYKKGKRVKSGSATCVGRQSDNYYLLTAKHVVDLGLSSNRVINIALTGKLPQHKLYATVWTYDKRGYILKLYKYVATVVWASAETDAALVCINAKNVPLNIAALASKDDYRNLNIGHVVMKAGCVQGLPPMYIRGYLARFDMKIKRFNFPVDVYTIHTHRGDSGSGLFLASNNRVVAISCIGRTDKITYFCGAVPVKNIFHELLKTDYKFLVPTE
jgi:hypothetical protein